MLKRATVEGGGAIRAWPPGLAWSKAKLAAALAENEFDHLTFTYLLRYVDDPAATLRELARVVKPGGRVAASSSASPRGSGSGPGASTPGSACRRSAGSSRARWYEAGRFLGPSIEGFYRGYPLRAAGRALGGGGDRRVAIRRMSLGGGVVIWGTVGD